MSDEKHAGAGEPTAEAFLHVLQKKELVPRGTIADLLKQVANSKTPVSARQVAKLLVDKGMLPAAVAQGLLSSKPEPAAKAPAASKAAGHAAPPAKPAAAPGGKKPSGPAAAPATGQPKPPPAEPPSGSGLASLLDEELASLSDGLPSLAGGPLDGLLNDPSLAATVQDGSPLDAPAAPRKRLGKSLRRVLWGTRRARKRLWIGIGVAAAGVAAIVAVSIWAATRQDPLEVLQPAEAAYQEGDYKEAVAQYEKFLERYPRHAVSGRVRVRRGLARLKLALAGSPGDSSVLAAAKSVLPEIGAEAEFDGEAGPLLAALLPPLVEASASRAQRRLDPAAIAQSKELLALAQQYIPAPDKPRERLGRAEAVLALAEHRNAAEGELKKALAEIQKAVSAKDFKEADRVRTALLDAQPQLANSDALAEAAAGVSAAEQAAVAWVAKEQPAEKEPAAGAIPTVVLAEQKCTASPPNAEGHVIVAVAAGAVYGLDAGNGKVLWRTFVGFNPEGRDEGCAPSPIARSNAIEARSGIEARSASKDLPGRTSLALRASICTDIVMAAASHHEVQRMETASGRAKWRHAVPEGLCGDPLAAEDQVLAATRSGRLVEIDAATGNSPGFTQFPRPLAVAPAVDPSRKLVFQPADCDNLFVLSLHGRRCRQAFPLGHRPGSIVVPPVVFGDHLLVAVNDTTNSSSLRVLEVRSTEAQSSEPPLRLVQTISLKGHVNAGPSIAGERVLLATDNGNVHLWERSATAGEPLREVAATTLPGGAGLARFPLLLGDTCLIGDVQLASLEIHPTRNQLSPAWHNGSPGAVCQPPVAIGQTVFYVRRAGDTPGVIVSAVNAGKGTPCWQTCLAVPLAGEPMTAGGDGHKIMVVTARGGVFACPSPVAPGMAVVDKPLAATPDPSPPVTSVVRFNHLPSPDQPTVGARRGAGGEGGQAPRRNCCWPAEANRIAS